MKFNEFQLQEFLKRMKTAARRPGSIVFIDRDKNLDAMERFGLNQDAVMHMVSNLTAAQYVDGPEADLDGSEGSVWKFSSFIESKEFYIKLKLLDANGFDYIKIISFHD